MVRIVGFVRCATDSDDRDLVNGQAGAVTVTVTDGTFWGATVGHLPVDP
jgi:hypothetical protein